MALEFYGFMFDTPLLPEQQDKVLSLAWKYENRIPAAPPKAKPLDFGDALRNLDGSEGRP